MARKIVNTRPQPELEKEYEDTIELTDPVTGKTSYHKVTIRRYKTSPHKDIVAEEDVVETLKNKDRLIAPDYTE